MFELKHNSQLCLVKENYKHANTGCSFIKVSKGRETRLICPKYGEQRIDAVNAKKLKELVGLIKFEISADLNDFEILVEKMNAVSLKHGYKKRDGWVFERNEKISILYKKYLAAETAKLGLKPITFCGEKGDVFIWHAQLYHGGSEILDPKQSRKSIVSHFWRCKDMPQEKHRCHGPGQYYLQREHQKVYQNAA